MTRKPLPRLSAFFICLLPAALPALENAWPPLLPAVLLQEAQKIARSSSGARSPVHAKMTAAGEGLPLFIELDFAGLGAEASRALEAASSCKDCRITRAASRYSLSGSGGYFFPLSAELGARLWRLNQHYRSESELLTGPVNHAALRQAALSPQGIKTITGLFESAIQGSLSVRLPYPVPKIAPEPMEGATVQSLVLAPETGGEAYLQGNRIVFKTIADSTRPVMRRLASAAPSTDQLAALYREYPKEMEILDARRSFGLLAKWLEKVPFWRAQEVPEDYGGVYAGRIVLTLIENNSEQYYTDPRLWLEEITGHDLAARYLGTWHLHPIIFHSGAWKPWPLFSPLKESGPTLEDLAAARQVGQYLTLVFKEDGFDLYDLSGTPKSQPGKEEAGVKKISYRGEKWRKHFSALPTP